MAVRSHDEDIDILILYGLGYNVFGIAVDQRCWCMKTGGLQRFSGPFELPGRFAAFLAGHQQMNWQTCEQRACRDHFNASAGHDATIERDHHAIGLGEALGNRQNRLVQATDNPLDVASQIALSMFCRFTAPSEYE